MRVREHTVSVFVSHLSKVPSDEIACHKDPSRICSSFIHVNIES